MSDFVLTLEENAFDSLAHGIEHFEEEERPTDLKYTVLHIFHAVELLLKARLVQADPFLLFEHPENPRNRHTVGFDEAIKRLNGVHVILAPESRKDLNYLRRVRNDIEHHRIIGDRQQIRDYVGRTMRFLDAFVEQELKIKLKERLPKDTYELMIEALYTYTERVAKARQEIEEYLIADKQRSYKIQTGYETLICENCGEETILFPDPTTDPGIVHCFFCHARFSMETCSRCGAVSLAPIAKGEDDEEPFDICENCWEQLLEE